MYTLKDFGSFHVGGRKVVVSGLPKRLMSYTPASKPTEKDPNGEYWIDQAYVQYFIPEGSEGKRPIVMLHGGGLTGMTWDTTPDGRPGWLQNFVGWGYPVYVVDQPERGRAGFSVVPDTWDGEPISRAAQEAWTLFRFGDAAGFSSRTPYEPCDFPIEALDRFIMQAVPRWTTTRAIHHAAFREVVERVGECTVICHSQGGDTAHPTAVARPDLVKALISLEPSGFAPDLGATRLDGQRYLYVYGDHIQKHAMWVELDGVARDNVARLEAAGATVDWLDLSDAGIAGASHMLMMDRSSAKSAALVREWLERD
jgi:pimeloyl-ACP methyl ester carboxylesterase